MVKKFTASLLIAAICLTPRCFAQDEEKVCEPKWEYSDTAKKGSDAAAEAIGASMFGWGIAIVVGITILALVLHNSTTTSHS